MNQGEQFRQSGDWLFGPFGASMSWPRSEALDPCFDQCKYQGTAGLVAINTQFMTLAFADVGYTIVRITAVLFAGGVGGAVPIQVQIVRQAGAGTEIVGLVNAAEFSNEAIFTFTCKVGPGGTLTLMNLAAIAAGSTVHATFHTKRISR